MMNRDYVVLNEDFTAFEGGAFSAEVGPLTEYHFLAEAAPRHGWSVACFSTDDQGSAWHVKTESGRKALWQTTDNAQPHTHPMVSTGDESWKDFDVSLTLCAFEAGRCGLVFRYHNNRCYYFFGFDGSRLVLLLVQHERDFHVPDETVLASRPYPWIPGREHTLTVSLRGHDITAAADGLESLQATDDTFPRGKIALLADRRTRFDSVIVKMATPEVSNVSLFQRERERRLEEREAGYPRPRLWKRIDTRGFGTGRNVRFGDINGDGKLEVVFGQVVAHGPRDAYSEVGCITAMNLDGRVLWQSGTANVDNYHLTNDVAFQVHDFDGDGVAEVVFARDFRMTVADGTTGSTRLWAPTPASKPPADRYDRILGDCIFFADIRGTGRCQDMLIKDRYWNFWIYDEKLRPVWEGSCNTGHYPYADDVDGDGKQELAIGYSLFDHDGALLWTLDDKLHEHADGIAIVDFAGKPSSDRRILYTASDEGFVLVDLAGNIIKHHRIGHAQNPTVARFRRDLPGLQAVSINFWGNQGILHYYDAEGNIYSDAEPVNMGSMCTPVNWTGEDCELFIHSANFRYGGLYDGWGEQVLRLPEDGHPELCCAALDLTGDCRDEIVVWDQREMWIYTQDDSPRSGRLYRPLRNPQHSQSNYQANVSLPGWSDA